MPSSRPPAQVLKPPTRRSISLDEMLIGVVLLLCLATVPLARGRLGAVADVRFRASWLALVAIAGQILIVSLLPQGNGALHHVVHLATYALIAAFLWANRHIAYLWPAALGGALNLVAITANGGVMPADRRALAAAGVHQQAGDFSNSTVVAHPHLAFLGDVFAVPASWPVSNVFSVGDVVSSWPPCWRCTACAPRGWRWCASPRRSPAEAGDRSDAPR